MNHILAAGSFMKVVNILGRHGQLGHMPSELSDSHIRTI
jgi:hypothetical protein